MEYIAFFSKHDTKNIDMRKDCKRCYHKKKVKNLELWATLPWNSQTLKTSLFISISNFHPTQKQHKINKPEIKGTITRLPNFPTS